MKKACWILIVFLLAIVARAQTNQRLCVVEITEPTQDKTQKVVTVEVFQSMQTEMVAKNRLLSKAVDLAIKEWKEKHADSGPFPRQSVSPGQVKSLGMFSDKAKAEQTLKDLRALEEQEEVKKLSGAEKQLEPLNKQLTYLQGVQNRTPAQQSQLTSVELNIKTLVDRIARQKKKEEDKNANLVIARELVKAKLKQLLAEQNGDSSAPDKQTK